MGKAILVLASTLLLTVMGLLVGITILWGLLQNYHDPMESRRHSWSSSPRSAAPSSASSSA